MTTKEQLRAWRDANPDKVALQRAAQNERRKLKYASDPSYQAKAKERARASRKVYEPTGNSPGRPGRSLSDALEWIAEFKSAPNEKGCCLWTGQTRGNSSFAYNQYALLVIGNKKYSAHRLQWELVNGPIPDGMLVCHHCDTPLCMNIEHHFLGTAKENTRDMIRKGRASGCAALVERNRKLSDAQVDEIRARRSSGETLTSLATHFGVGISQVHRIVNGQSRAGKVG